MHLLATAAPPPHPTLTLLTLIGCGSVLILIGALTARALRDHHRRVMPKIRALDDVPVLAPDDLLLLLTGHQLPAQPYDVAVDAAGRRFLLEHDTGDVLWLDDRDPARPRVMRHPGGHRG